MMNDDLHLPANIFAPGPQRINRDALEALLNAAEILRQANTGIADWIRVLSVNEQIIVQEQDPDGNVFIRCLSSVEEADAFVNDRLETYERMWDG